MIIPVNKLCKHSRVNNPWRTILPTKTHMDARHPRTELKTMSSFKFLKFSNFQIFKKNLNFSWFPAFF